MSSTCFTHLPQNEDIIHFGNRSPWKGSSLVPTSSSLPLLTTNLIEWSNNATTKLREKCFQYCKRCFLILKFQSQWPLCILDGRKRRGLSGVTRTGQLARLLKSTANYDQMSTGSGLLGKLQVKLILEHYMGLYLRVEKPVERLQRCLIRICDRSKMSSFLGELKSEKAL